LLRIFAGFCLIADGAYIGIGAFGRLEMPEAAGESGSGSQKRPGPAIRR
jgi:hypothetical protein